jgi:cytochrome P450
MESPSHSTAEAYGVLEQLADLAAPQPTYRKLIDQGGLFCPMDGMAIAVSRAAVDQVLKDPGTYSSEGFLNLGNTRPLIPLSVDPPRHVKYRKILDPLFAPKKMDAIEDRVTARFDHFLDQVVDRGECHFTDEIAVPFPSAIFLELMGLPWEELDVLLRLKDGILRSFPEDSPEQRAQRQADTGQEIYAYFEAILDERAGTERDDILTHFLHAEIDGERLSRDEIVDICFLFLIAGLDTVTDSLTCMFAFLAQHPEHRRQIADNPEVIPAAVEEMLRWETPVTQTPRMTTTDAEIVGCPVKAGTFVSVMLGGANVDPAEFDEPDVVRFDREQNRHLAFGGGVHRCLGSHLARRELRVALKQWHARIPDYDLKPGIELHYPLGLRTVENLELTWKA